MGRHGSTNDKSYSLSTEVIKHKQQNIKTEKKKEREIGMRFVHGTNEHNERIFVNLLSDVKDENYLKWVGDNEPWDRSERTTDDQTMMKVGSQIPYSNKN